MSEVGAARPGPALAAPRFAFVYLASQSPRRGQLLDQIGVRHQPLLAAADEDAEALEAERPGEAPLAYVRRVTRAKLDAARLRLVRRGGPQAPILCADTTVAIGRAILGKPRDAAEASEMLRRLSDRSHRVITAVAVSMPPGLDDSREPHAPKTPRSAKTRAAGRLATEGFATSVSSVRFGVIGADEIARCVASGEPFGKAGAYAIQGRAAAWIERIAGSHSGIMGLPLYETAQLLRRAGVGF